MINYSDSIDVMVGLLVTNCCLEQLSFQSNLVDVSKMFLQSVSAHGELVQLFHQCMVGDGMYDCSNRKL